MSATTVDGRVRDVSTSRVFARTCAAEWTRLWSVKSTWWFLAAAAVVLLGLGTAVGLEQGADSAGADAESAWTTVRFIALPAQFAILGLAVTAVTGDYGTGGIIPTLQWTPRRTILFAARTIVTATTATVLGVLLAVASALIAFVAAGSALTLRLAESPDLLVPVAFVFATETVLAVGLGFVLRSTAGALVGAFLLMLILPVLLRLFGQWTATLSEMVPGSGAMYLLARQLPGMTTTSSVVVMLAWAVGVPLLGWFRLKRDDANR